MKKFSVFVFVLILIWGGKLSAQIILSEVVSSNTDAFDYDGKSPDYIELHNIGSVAASTEGLYISDDTEDLKKYALPTILIAPDDYLLILADGDDFVDEYIHTNFKVSSEETIVLSDENDVILDSVTLPDLVTDIAYSFINGEWVLAQPSPGMSNDGSQLPDLMVPSFSQVTGLYDGEISLNISSSYEAAEIEYYINDLSTKIEPQKNSVNITLSTSAIVCARAKAAGLDNTEYRCESYIIGANHKLPVLSIIADEFDLFDSEEGLFELGPNAEEEWPYLGANFWSDRSEEVYFKYFNDDDMEVFSGHCDLEMHGGRQARTNPQKTFRLMAKTKYDQAFFEYPFFETAPEIESYKRLVVRNASGDYNVGHCRDGFLQKHMLENDLYIDGNAYQPIAVYINGDYYGLMGLREKVDKYYTQSHYGTTDIHLLEEELIVVEGDFTDFVEMLAFASQNNLGEASNYNMLSERVDIENIIDYFVVQVGNNNADWPLNNIKYWREITEGSKWKYLLFDMDAALGRFSWTRQDVDQLTSKLSIPEENSVFISLMKALLDNEEFKTRLINRHQDLYNTAFSTEVMLPAFESFAESIDDEISSHLNLYPSLTYNDWKTVELEIIKDYIRERPDYTMQYFQDYFGLEKLYRVSITSTIGNDAAIDLNSLRNISDGFEGRYFTDVPITFTAKSVDDHEFSHWEVVKESGNVILGGSSLSMTFAEDTQLLAVYDQNTEGGSFVEKVTLSKSNLQLIVNLDSQEDVEYLIADISGRIIHQGQFSGSPIGRNIWTIPLADRSNEVKVIYVSQGENEYSIKIALVE